MSDLAWLALAVVAGLAGIAMFGFGARVVLHEFHVARWRRSLVAFELRLPRTATVAEVSRWVGTLRAMVPARRWWSPLPRCPLVVETTATREGIRRVLLVPARLRTEVVATLGAVISGARPDELPDYLTTTTRHTYQAAGEARLRGFGDLLAVGRAEDASRHVLAALQPLEAGEVVRVQWVVTGARAPRWITSPSTDDTDMPKLWRADDPMLSATCRVAVSSRFGRARARSIFGRVWASLRSMNTPRTRMVRRWWVPRFAAAARLHLRSVPRGRWPIVTTSAELAGLLGFAAGAMSLPGVPGGVSRTLPTPPSMPAKGLVIARSNYPGMSGHDLTQSMRDRLTHTWVLGPTGTGKTTLLAGMALHDIAAGHGAVVVDAGGALIARIAERIPAHRLDDVIVLDPSEIDHVVSLNPLAAGEPEQAANLVYHILHSIFVKSWGPRTADIMRAGLLTLTHTRAANGQRFTLVDMPELLTNAAFRRSVIRQNLSPQLGSFWRWYESLSEPAQLNAVGPVLNKLRAFTLSTPLRLMLGNSSGIDMSQVMREKKILLVSLKKALLGAENSALIGSLITSAVWQATLERVTTHEDARIPYWLYADEFQDVVRLPMDIGAMLEQARNLKLGLILAHQVLRQLDRELQASVLGTARTHILFQLGVEDSKRLAESFTPLTADDLRHLGAYEVAVRPCVNGATTTPVTGKTYPLPEPTRDGDALAQESRERFGTPREDVEAAILERLIVPAGARSNEITFGDES
ncbi:MAG: type IV secretory system conjugative DNA transfer family protein [Pseudonocardiaceae bacterium]